MTTRLNRFAFCLVMAACALNVPLATRPVSAHEIKSSDTSDYLISETTGVHERTSELNARHSGEAPIGSKPAPQSSRRSGSAKGPYYVDFRARTAASWGHAFVWFGKTSERQVEVAGLTPAGDTFAYVLGYFTWVPSETGASYGDLDPQYLSANYRVYLNEADAKEVFAYIRKLQASSPLWNAEISNCTAFVGSIATFMGLKTPVRWTRPEDYINSLKRMNGGRQLVQLRPER